LQCIVVEGFGGTRPWRRSLETRVICHNDDEFEIRYRSKEV
jgi:hypothetical protein